MGWLLRRLRQGMDRQNVITLVFASPILFAGPRWWWWWWEAPKSHSLLITFGCPGRQTKIYAAPPPPEEI